MCRRDHCRVWVCRADRRRHSTPRIGPRRGVSRPARRWKVCSRRRSRRRRAAPACREDHRARRTKTSLVQLAGATSRPAATADQSVLMLTPRTMPSRSGPRKPGHSTRASPGRPIGRRSARRLGCCRRLVRLSLPLPGGWLVAGVDRWLALWEIPLVPAGGGSDFGDSSLAWARSRCSGVVSTASGTRTLRRNSCCAQRASTVRTQAGCQRPTTRVVLRWRGEWWLRPTRPGRGRARGWSTRTASSPSSRRQSTCRRGADVANRPTIVRMMAPSALGPSTHG